MRIIRCCKDCKERHIGCHGSCKDYIEQSKELIESRNKYRLENDSGKTIKKAKVWSHRSTVLRNSSHKK